jgi:hypothetical protein
MKKVIKSSQSHDFDFLGNLKKVKVMTFNKFGQISHHLRISFPFESKLNMYLSKHFFIE